MASRLFYLGFPRLTYLTKLSYSQVPLMNVLGGSSFIIRTIVSEKNLAQGGKNGENREYQQHRVLV
jgi:hypothetical protein